MLYGVDGTGAPADGVVQVGVVMALAALVVGALAVVVPVVAGDKPLCKRGGE